MKTNKRQGISLIVLVITIIIMIILAASIILSLESSGIIGKATEAKKANDNSSAKEVVALAKAEYDLLSDNEKEDTPFSEYAATKLKEAGFRTEGEGSYEVTDNGVVYPYPVIPDGFVVSSYSGEQKVSDGLVIYEASTLSGIEKTTAMEKYNQFVWIPVTDISQFLNTDGYVNGKLQTYVYENNIKEPYTPENLSALSDKEQDAVKKEQDEYNAMKASVKKYGGFYIARYEAGDGEAKTNRTGVTVGKTVVSKKGASVYNHVPWGESITSIDPFTCNGVENVSGAVILSRGMYNNNSSVSSTLCYGVQWDAVMNFMKDVPNPNGDYAKYYIRDSRRMGWYYETDGDMIFSDGGPLTGTDLGEAALNKVKNIYDMAGNVEEYTMERLIKDSKKLVVLRGGEYYSERLQFSIFS